MAAGEQRVQVDARHSLAASQLLHADWIFDIVSSSRVTRRRSAPNMKCEAIGTSRRRAYGAACVSDSFERASVVSAKARRCIRPELGSVDGCRAGRRRECVQNSYSANWLSWLRRYYARRLPPSMTEDAVQDVLLAIHEKRHTYDPARPFGPWLAAIARYKWIDRLRSLKAEASEPLDENIGCARSWGLPSLPDRRSSSFWPN